MVRGEAFYAAAHRCFSNCLLLAGPARRETGPTDCAQDSHVRRSLLRGPLTHLATETACPPQDGLAVVRGEAFYAAVNGSNERARVPGARTFSRQDRVRYSRTEMTDSAVP
jgi:hypothetical protein